MSHVCGGNEGEAGAVGLLYRRAEKLYQLSKSRVLYLGSSIPVSCKSWGDLDLGAFLRTPA